jgi:aminoglycoside phosphotransferase (APT) family kinase protein
MEPLHDDEADTGLEVVLDLLRSQAPHLAALSLARISGTAGNTGSDNVLYRLGTELVVRLPRTPSAATSLRTETRLLPHLAGRLPVALPELVHLGSASARYPHPWAVLRWLPGRDAWADRATLDDPHGFRLAEDLAAVVDALGKVPRAAYGDIVEVRPLGDVGAGSPR